MTGNVFITLVRPPILTPQSNPIVQYTPPIGIAYLAASVREAGFPVQVIDGLGEGLEQRHPWPNRNYIYGLDLDEVTSRISQDATLIGISTDFSFEWPVYRALIGKIRARFPEAFLVAGGEHATALPALCLKETTLDAVVSGEGEETLVQIARCLAGGDRQLAGVMGVCVRSGDGIELRERQKRIRNLDAIPWPAWDLVPIEGYLDRGMGFGVNRGRSLPLLASRGCPYRCVFCSSPMMWTTLWQARSPDLLLDEIEAMQKRYQVSNFDFYDLTAIVKKAWIIEFCRKIEERGLEFTWQLPSGTRTEAIDADVAQLLYRTGCRNISYSPESGSPSTLRRIKKKIDVNRLAASVKSSVDCGLNVKCNLIIGFPGETFREIMQTLAFAARLALMGSHDISIWLFSPYPGSEVFNDLHEAGKIQLDDAYFNDLRAYADLAHASSFNEYFSARTLGLLRLLGTALFYFVSWTLRPVRVLRMIVNLTKGKQESRFELALSTLFRSRRATPSGTER
ncbi:MAG: B12-binding domain-containing radical SAM protein [Rhizobiales bacterium]|nr:B12-binding domain-containing radical SAM protein [Hyphomicrobiales bacterium]